MNLDKIFEFDRLAREDGNKYPLRRELFGTLSFEKGKHVSGVVGPRGVGKTVLLKQLNLEFKNSLYFSADTIDDDDLFSVVKNLHEKYKIEIFLIDEIHFVKEFDRYLKQICDFLSVKVFFSSSISVLMYKSSYDLSRRVRLYELFPLSFREYLRFNFNVGLPPLSMADVLAQKWGPEYLRHGSRFEQYLKGGVFPFSIDEPDVFPFLKNILNKVTHHDIPKAGNLRVDELGFMDKMLQFIGTSSVDGVNYSSLSQNIGITKYKAEQYVSFFQQAFVLSRVFPAGSNVLREPKVLMWVPFRFLYSTSASAVGGVREDFFVQMMFMKNISISYLKSTRGEKTPDYLLKIGGKKVVAEIGGKGKGRRQFKGVKFDQKVIFSDSMDIASDKLPLFMVGFLS